MSDPESCRPGLLRQLPSVSDVLGSGAVAPLLAEFGDGVTKAALRGFLDDIRGEIRGGTRVEIPSMDAIARALRADLVRRVRPEGRRAINATGILLHTCLGRAPLSAAAVEALSGMCRYHIVQADCDTGERTAGDGNIEAMLRDLTGCEAATVVNNNAAATLLVLNTLAPGREVVVSRGQLIEIGGSFRLPEVMARSSCTLRAVGTTNHTHLGDYAGAIGERTGAVMHVHASNYHIAGFASAPEIRELVALARRHRVPVIDDVGNGALVPLGQFGLRDEPLVKDSIAAGADVVCFSGDKLVCGPQAGIICGHRTVIERIRRNPLARMCRVCKMTLAAMEATLVHFVNEDYRRTLPLYRMLARELAELDAQAERAAADLGRHEGVSVSVVDELSYLGSGSAPDEGLATRAVRLRSARVPAERLARALRERIPSVFARIKDDALLLDMRTVDPDELPALAEAVRTTLRNATGLAS